ncbi:ATP-binding protein [Halobacterium zhouii]|uniref:ATP-binding protein n=1 Tax=Halobacterium zhouii TaxID=2902624 RepID=UPI003D7ADFA4
MDVLGRSAVEPGRAARSIDQATRSGVHGRLGRYLATDGSLGARVGVDFERPHAGVVVGKRGAGKSYTLGVLAEGLAAAPGVAPVVVDPMGAFRGLAEAGTDAGSGCRVVEPRVRADAIPPRAWCRVLGLEPSAPAGTLVWRAADERETLAGMRSWVERADAADAARRAASNHLALAESWGCFGVDDAGGAGGVDGGGDADGAGGADGANGTVLSGTGVPDSGVVFDCTRLRGGALHAVVFAVAESLYRSALKHAEGDDGSPLPWLLVDEAHACASGVAADAIETLYTRGRAPGASVVLATQRPSALPDVAVSQSDLVVAHRLTSGDDVDALAATRPMYLERSLASRLPENRGEALVVDDATESACTIRVRERRTEHGGGSARASGSRGGE